MELKDVFALMDRFDASAAGLLELELHGARLRLEKGCAVPQAASASPAPAPQAPAAPVPEAQGSFITAPLVGAVYAASGPDALPFAPVGATVKKGQTVCILEAMKMMSEVPAPMDCVIEEVLARDGALCEFGAPLFRVREL